MNQTRPFDGIAIFVKMTSHKMWYRCCRSPCSSGAIQQIADGCRRPTGPVPPSFASSPCIAAPCCILRDVTSHPRPPTLVHRPPLLHRQRSHSRRGSAPSLSERKRGRRKDCNSFYLQALPHFLQAFTLFYFILPCTLFLTFLILSSLKIARESLESDDRPPGSMRCLECGRFSTSDAELLQSFFVPPLSLQLRRLKRNGFEKSPLLSKGIAFLLLLFIAGA